MSSPDHDAVYGISSLKARWIRLGAIGQQEFDSACIRLARAQSRFAAPVLVWAQGGARHLFALIAPLKYAPGARALVSWAAAAAVATYRQFGVPAYLEGERFGCMAARSPTARWPVGECAVVASSFLTRFPGSCVATPPRELEQAFRLRLEAQHGWEFDHSWPTEAGMRSPREPRS